MSNPEIMAQSADDLSITVVTRKARLKSQVKFDSQETRHRTTCQKQYYNGI
jgi:hypothetical protein